MIITLTEIGTRNIRTQEQVRVKRQIFTIRVGRASEAVTKKT